MEKLTTETSKKMKQIHVKYDKHLNILSTNKLDAIIKCINDYDQKIMKIQFKQNIKKPFNLEISQEEGIEVLTYKIY